MASQPLSGAAAPALVPDPSSLLGFGFNVYGPGDLASGTTQAVVNSADNSAASPTDQQATYLARTFDSRDEVMQEFSSEVSASVSGTCFSGEFNATYGTQSSSDESVSYGLYDVVLPTETLKLENSDRNSWAEGFTTDEDVENVPDVFSPATREQFFRIFRRFGTHVVSEISLGGRLRAYSTASLSADMSSQQASANMKLEYNAVFADSTVEMQAAWATLGNSWTSSRELSFDVLGGDAAPLAEVVPAYNEGAQAAVATWLASVPAKPGVAGFRLQRISALFDGRTQTAVDDAIDAYLGGLLRVEAWALEATTPSSVTLPDQPPAYVTAWGTAPPPATQPATVTPWMWIVLLDPTAPAADIGAAVLNKAYRTYLPGADATIESDLAAARAKVPEPLVILCGTVPFADGHPLPAGLQILVSQCGFDLEGCRESGQWSGVRVLSLIGRANHGDPCAATAKKYDSDRLSTGSATTVVDLASDPLVVVDQTGTVLSPLAA